MGAEPDLSGVKVVFFDLDDTLCAYWNAAKAGLRAAFEAWPVPGRTTEEAIAAWSEEFRTFAHELKTSHWYEIYLQQGAVTRVQLMKQALERLGVEDAELAWHLSESYGAERDARLMMFPEAVEVLEAIRPHVKIGLITNGPADIQRQEIATCGIGHLLDYVLIEGEMGVGKPHKRVMQKAESVSGASAQEILFVGNSYAHDMVPAIEAGWLSAWVRRPSDVAPSSRSGKPEERPEGSEAPTLEIQDLSSLPALLTGGLQNAVLNEDRRFGA